MFESFLQLTEKGFVPSGLVRYGIRALCRQKLKDIQRNNPEELIKGSVDFIYKDHKAPIALESEKANEQHYELPTDFFKLVLAQPLAFLHLPCWPFTPAFTACFHLWFHSFITR